MRDMSWDSFVEQPDVLVALRKLDPKVDDMTTYQRRRLVCGNAATVFETTPPGCPGMSGSLSVIEWEGYYIVVSRSGDCFGPVHSFQEVIDGGALPTGDEDPVVDCSLSDEETFAMASEMVGLKGGIVINGEKMVVNEETLTPDWRGRLGEERDGLVCLGSGNHCDYFTWDDNHRVLKFYAPSVKWYESYPEVDRFAKFLAEVHALEYEYEFIRVGEEDDDLETDSTGDAENYMYVERTIQVNL